MVPFEYSAVNSSANSVLTRWRFKAQSYCNTWVIPDGCRDIIVRYSNETDATWFLSDLSLQSYRVPSHAGTQFEGLRLAPSVTLDESKLTQWLQGRQLIDLFNGDQIDEFCVQDKTLSMALDCLSHKASSVQCIASELGMSPRTLQRLVKSGTGESPYFWFALSRVRNAARALFSSQNIGEVAANAGYADQAHMNREMKKWFQLTPNQIKADSSIRELLFESGYGHAYPTGEQISIKKPFGSET